MTVTYLTAEEILLIHARIIDVIGGAEGIRDIERVRSMIKRPQQHIKKNDLYPTLFEKAAVYFEVSAYHHPFTDGNKRTAIACAGRFLFLNGYTLKVSNNVLVKFVITAVVEKYDIPTLASWFKKHSKPIKT